MERTKETLEARVRETPLVDRLKECRQRIGKMCAELRGPKMSIPVEYYDDDFYICTTLADAQAAVEALRAQLTALRELVGQWAWNTTNLLGDYRIATVADFNAEWTRRSIWLIEAVQATLPPPQAEQDQQTMYELRQQVEALQRERDKLREATKVICGHCCEPMAIPSKAILQSQLSALQGLVRAYGEAKVAFDEGRLREDHHAWKERFNKLELAEAALIDYTMRTLDATTPAVCPDCDGDGVVDSGGTDPNGNPLMRRCGCREKGGDGE